MKRSAADASRVEREAVGHAVEQHEVGGVRQGEPQRWLHEPDRAGRSPAQHPPEGIGSGVPERRRDLLGSIMVIGGASKTPHLGAYLESQIRQALPQYPKEILVAPPPKDLDPAIIVWKGGSVFGKLRMTNDSWIGGLEYDRLGARILNYKCMWHW